jgi:ribosomal protein S18 acetylase RimI-like enzyme
MTELVIRPARKDDASFLAWAVIEAARSHRPRGFWDLWIPNGDARLAFVEQLLVAPRRSMWHWTVFHVAEWRGRPAATLSGCDPSRIAPADVAVGEVMVESGWSEGEGAAAIARATPFFGCMHETPPGAWLVESVATRPEARGHGLAAALVEHILEDGRRRGHSEAKLSLMIGNSAAQRLYERAGFAITAEKRDAALDAVVGCPGVAQMSCRL